MDRLTDTSRVVPMVDWNPLDWLGDRAQEGLADAWTATMISLWSAGMWLLETVFTILDRFLTPDLRDPGLAPLYGITVWISLVVALVIGLGQVGLAAIRRDGTTLGTLAVGLVQYGAVLACWVAVFGGIVLACAGLTTGLLDVLLGIEDFTGYPAGAGWPDQVGGTVAATALGMCALFLLLPAGFGFIVIMLVREAALLVLAATMPIAAAGTLGDGTRAWMWKSIRWFLAACLTAPLLALVLGLGVQITRAAFPDHTDSASNGGGFTAGAGGAAQRAETVARIQDPAQAVAQSSQVGMAVVGCVLMVVACFCPMVLFRLLAFVDPGTGSGASFRSAMTANGGLGGLLGGRTPGGAGSGAATQTAGDGRAASEDSADAETANRFQSGAVAAFVPLGGVVAGGMRAMGAVAQHGASLGVDVMGQGGFGAQGYYDTTAPRQRAGGSPLRTRMQAHPDPDPDGDSGAGAGGDAAAGLDVGGLDARADGGGTGAALDEPGDQPDGDTGGTARGKAARPGAAHLPTPLGRTGPGPGSGGLDTGAAEEAGEGVVVLP
jgi:type IV secretion system protein TrbL